MGRAKSPVAPFHRVTDEGVAVQRRRGRRSLIGVDDGIAPTQSRRQDGVVEPAAVTAVPGSFEDALPSLLRKPHFDADRRIVHGGHGGGHPAEGRQVGVALQIASRERPRGDALRRRDRRVFDFEVLERGASVSSAARICAHDRGGPADRNQQSHPSKTSHHVSAFHEMHRSSAPVFRSSAAELSQRRE